MASEGFFERVYEVVEQIPCHRVVFADGRICEGFAFGGPDAQRELLLGEGVTFADPMHVDLAACRWPAGL